MKIKPLKDVPIHTIHKAFKNAFADYTVPFDLTENQLTYMIERRGFNAALSFGAFEKNELIGFTLNGIGEWKGALTAYDTGTGVVQAFRKKGIATLIFDRSLPVLRAYSIKQYLLEVIKTNTHAFRLYKNAGFDVVRELDFYVELKDKIKIHHEGLSKEYSIDVLFEPDWALLKTFWDTEPSWQNSIDSMNRKRDHFKILGIYYHNDVIGYGIVETTTGDIPQIAISREHRRKKLCSVLMERLINESESEKIRIINIDAQNKALTQFIRSINMQPGDGQFEMILKL